MSSSLMCLEITKLFLVLHLKKNQKISRPLKRLSKKAELVHGSLRILPKVRLNDRPDLHLQLQPSNKPQAHVLVLHHPEPWVSLRNSTSRVLSHICAPTV